jgi:ubiquinol-cytochrome c reductase cytochrome b subunit
MILLYARKSLLYLWNFGSILLIFLLIQILTGLFLAFYYTNDSLLAFNSVQYIIYEVFGGWFIRILHFNGARFFFFFLYLHFFKGLFFFRYRLLSVWVVGLFMFLLFIAIAFIGYVLVWAQMRFWASVVITSLLTVIPYWGFSIVFWIWGGFSVVSSTLKFFFVLHFLLPWLSWILVLFHLFFLHVTGSTSSLFCYSDYDKIFFFSFFFYKDLVDIFCLLWFFIFSIYYPFILGDSEIFLESNLLISPIHIVPEWYFLFAYAILRCIPRKSLGVLFLLFSIFIYFLFLLVFSYYCNWDIFNNFFLYSFFFVCFFLRWLGQCVIEFPFIYLRVLFSFFYFFLVFIILFINFLARILFI